MQVKVRPLNAGETFCCSIKKAKAVFRDTNVYLNFAFFGRDFGTFARTADRFYCERNVRGIVVSNMHIYSRSERPMLSFYALREKDFPEERKREFEQKYLPKYYTLYQEMLYDWSLIRVFKFMLVEWINGELKLHEQILKY